MKEMIAFCGLTCHDCGALLATQDDDDAKRAEVAQQWSKLFKVDIKSESINCDGCLSEGGQIFSYCEVCEIRKCAMEKDVMNCAYCNEYACEKLEKFFHMAPDAKKQFDEIRSSM
jgi:hypothetical protein